MLPFHNKETRVKEHLGNIKNGEIEKSAVAAHVWIEIHAIDCKPVLLKQASNKQELTNYRNRFVTQYITYLNIREALSGTLSPLSTHDRLILV